MSNEPPAPRPFQGLSGEALRNKARSADAALGRQLARLRAHDPVFRAALDLTLALDDEIAARRNRP